ncbi:putative cysteine-rich receptor-like protein kinase 20 [Acorus calamus]|uniref:Cysteine-rich receptor-like protein kinase 20 n=1 Tax=Acorus calamus TaxID=4465 RepID=A0AAV9DSZ6_ACOCL|nr:putative cysteine-rich receptor-like protein kinase 20 [Acorus calamus]
MAEIKRENERVCRNNGNYTTNSTYQSNLNTLLRSLSSNGPTTGFSTTTQGSSPDQVGGLVLCCGNTDVNACASCLDNAVPDIIQLYDDCFLRYSNIRFFSSVDASPGFLMWNANNASDPRSLFATVYGLMGSLINETAGGPGMFTTGEVAVNGTGGGQKVYGLA